MAAAEADPTGILAAHVASTDAASMPARVVRQASSILVDAIGVTIAGSRGEAVRVALAAIGESPGAGTVIGHGRISQPEVAAFLNAMAATAVDLDDTHSPSLTHPSSVLVPAALAAADISDCDGMTLLSAIVAGYDLEARLSRAMGPQAQFDRGFHPASVCGAVGAAATAGRILGLSVDELRIAIALGGSQSAGLVTFRSDPTGLQKSFQIGTAARSGVFAAMLARGGFPAAANVLGDRFDLLGPFGGSTVNREQLTADLGRRYEILGTTLKRHPSCGRSHAAVDALLELRTEHAIKPDSIEEIRVEVAHSAVVTIDRRPQLTHNIQFLMAVVAIDGFLERQQLNADHAERPEVQALVSRISLAGNDELEARFPDDKSAIVTVRTADATYQRAMLAPRGSPTWPLTNDELRQKFRSLASERYEAARVTDIVGLLDGVTSLTSIRLLLRELGA